MKSPYDQRRRAEDWADRRTEYQSPYEPTYPDGSVRHECWNPAATLQKPSATLRQERRTMADDD